MPAFGVLRFRTHDPILGIPTRYVEYENGSGTVYYVDKTGNHCSRSLRAPMAVHSPADMANRLEQWIQQDGQTIIAGWE